MAVSQLELVDGDVIPGPPEEFVRTAEGLERTVTLRQRSHTTALGPVPKSGEAFAHWWKGTLKEPKRPRQPSGTASLNVLDLFSSVGGLSLGFSEAAHALGFRARTLLAVDVDADALQVFNTNHRPRGVLHRSVADLVHGQPVGHGIRARWSSLPRPAHVELEYLVDRVDVILAGPPCQGHSSLNNRTRGDDPRNRLYLAVPAAAIATNARAVVIENVPNVVHDKNGVVQTTGHLLREAGYHVTSAVLAADKLGWAQTRRRYFLVATRDGFPLELPLLAQALERKALPLSWAIGDLNRRKMRSGDVMQSVPDMSEENRLRIEHLFEKDCYDLPDYIRPDCHKDGNHTYGAVYGRMYWDKPAGTITGGFMTPGRGRFVHPLQPRVLTPREAARVQGFPDWFTFQPPGLDQPKRSMLAKWIGDAVPSILGYVAGLSALSGLKEFAE